MLKEKLANPGTLKKIGTIGLGVGLVGTFINGLVSPKVQEAQVNEKVEELVKSALENNPKD